MISKRLALIAVAAICWLAGSAQGIAITDQSDHQPDSSSILDLFTTEKGLLLPRLTSSQIQSLEDPADGLVVYNISDGKVYIYRDIGSSWKALDLGTETITPFTCGNTWYDYRDGKSYSTVLINDRCWFAQNLNVGTYVSNSTGQGNNQVIEKYCYNNVEANCATWGGLYYSGEAMDYSTQEGARGICPEGWHIPTDLEWFYMENYLDNTITNINVIGLRGTNCGNQLKTSGTTYWNSPNGGTNSSGFSGRGAGMEYWPQFTGHFFTQLLEYGYFWTSSDTANFSGPFFSGPLTRYLYYNSALSGRGYDDHMSGGQAAYSVRCIKD